MRTRIRSHEQRDYTDTTPRSGIHDDVYDNGGAVAVGCGGLGPPDRTENLVPDFGLIDVVKHDRRWVDGRFDASAVLNQSEPAFLLGILDGTNSVDYRKDAEQRCVHAVQDHDPNIRLVRFGKRFVPRR